VLLLLQQPSPSHQHFYVVYRNHSQENGWFIYGIVWPTVFGSPETEYLPRIPWRDHPESSWSFPSCRVWKSIQFSTFLGGFLNRGTPNHPAIRLGFSMNHPANYWGIPMKMEPHMFIILLTIRLY
jgi:hypothetical protein